MWENLVNYDFVVFKFYFFDFGCIYFGLGFYVFLLVIKVFEFFQFNGFLFSYLNKCIVFKYRVICQVISYFELDQIECYYFM